MQLRDYQETDIASIRAAMREYRRVLYVAPTGSGKTVVFSHIAEGAERKGSHVLILSHRQEIADQISNELADLGIPHGQTRPGEPKVDALVQVGMVMTVARRLETLQRPDLVIVDEAHHAAAKTWRRIEERWRGAYFLGFTATPQRLDGQGLRDCFDTMVLGPEVRPLIAAGYLADFDYYLPSTVDLTGVRKLAGDYKADELEQIMMERPKIMGDAVAYYQKYLGCHGRTAIAFCCTVAHARWVAQQFKAADIPAEVIDGNMTREARRDLVERFRRGEVKVLASCDVISEGFNVPGAGGALMLRPTQSLALARQQMGRALRPKEDGSKAVILDHVGNYHRFGWPDEPQDWTLDGDDKKEKDAKGKGKPYRKCKTCDRLFSARHQQDWCDGAPDGCLFSPPATMDAELFRIEMPRIDVGDVAWAEEKGLDIATARRADWFRLLDAAGADPVRLHQIARARHFHPRWVEHRLRDAAEVARRMALFEAAHPPVDKSGERGDNP